MEATERVGEPAAKHDPGFTLVELFVVIVILGVVATVVIFAVGGVTERGEQASDATDERIIVTAQEAYRALNGVYASEVTLVSAGLMRSQSEMHDVVLNPDGIYAVVASLSP